MILSIITITYNNFEELEKTLLSVPSYNNIEKIVINGGDCLKTEDYLSSQQDIISVSEADDGIADAFNKGLEIASGDLILFLNSGDFIINQDYFSWLLNQKEGDFFFGGMIFDDYEYGEVPIFPHGKNLGHGMPFPHQTLAVKRYVFERIGHFNKSFSIAMDYDFVCRMLKEGFKGIEYKGEPVVMMDGAGVSRKKEFLSWYDSYKALRNSQLLLKPHIFCSLLGRLIRIILRKTLEKVGLRKLIKKIKLQKNYNRS